jgi:hypothetical protein
MKSNSFIDIYSVNLNPFNLRDLLKKCLREKIFNKRRIYILPYNLKRGVALFPRGCGSIQGQTLNISGMGCRVQLWS